MQTVQTTDLTEGVPIRVLTVYAIPMLISMFFQQAYNLADSWIAGNLVGADALSAVGICYPVTVFLIAISSGLSLGTSIFCAEAFGKKALRDVRSAFSTSLGFYIPVAVIIAVSGFFLSPAVMRWLSVPEELKHGTLVYLRLYLLGFPFQFIYNIANSTLTGLGNSRTPLVLLIVSSICNVILDILLVAVFSLGIAGLALATVISQAFSALLGILFSSRVCRSLCDSLQTFSSAILKKMLRLGVPSMMQHLFMSLGQLSLQGVINSYGSIVIAGYSVAFRVNGIVINSLMALSNALSGFIAQNHGAGNHSRIRQGIRISLFLGYAFSFAVIVVLCLFGRQILAFFLLEGSDTPNIIEAGMSFFRVVVPFYLLVTLKIISDGSLRGLGMMNAFMLATAADVLVRILFGNLFSVHWGLIGVWYVWPVAWFFGTVSSCIPLVHNGRFFLPSNRHTNEVKNESRNHQHRAVRSKNR